MNRTHLALFLYYRNVLILGVAQAASMVAVIMLALVGSLIGMSLAPSPEWATFPLGSMASGAVLFTIPAAWLMSKIGRQRGFVIAASVAACAALSATYAIAIENFLLFNLSVFFVGANMAFVQQFRFAAAESVAPHHAGKAVAWVLLGSVAAAYLGPKLGVLAKNWLPYGDYSGSLFSLACLFVFAAILLCFFEEAKPLDRSEERAQPRPLWTLVTQPEYIIAVMAAMMAVGIMNFIMTATPVSMHINDGYSVDQTAWVIQGHAMAMFLPALFTGQLIARWGLSKVMLSGVGAMVLCVGIAVANRHFPNYWVALALLGVGWNFLFISGTALLVKSYHFFERFKAQAVNDFLVFGVGALANFLAGKVLHELGWKNLNLLSIPFLFVLTIAIVVLYRRHEFGTVVAPPSRQ